MSGATMNVQRHGKLQMANVKWQMFLDHFSFAEHHLPFAIYLLPFAMLFAVPAATAANVATSPLSAARAYPNPWRSDKHMAMSIKFAGLPAASTVKIFTISGHEVKTVSADSNGLASWDRVNDQGDPVASGIYIYLIIDPHGNETSGKIAIIK